MRSKIIFLFQRGGFLARPEFRNRSPMQRRLEGEGEEMVDEEEEKEDANNVMKDHEEEEEEARMNNHNDNNNSNHTEEKVRDNHRLGTC